MEPRGPFSVVGVPADTCWERCGMFSGLGDIVSAADHPHLSLSLPPSWFHSSSILHSVSLLLI